METHINVLDNASYKSMLKGYSKDSLSTEIKTTTYELPNVKTVVEYIPMEDCYSVIVTLVYLGKAYKIFNHINAENFENNIKDVIVSSVSDIATEADGLFKWEHEKVKDWFVERVYKNITQVMFPKTLAKGGVIKTDGSQLFIAGLVAGQVFDTSNWITSTDSKKLPAMDTLVEYPCNCQIVSQRDKMWTIVQHLNDRDKWTRNRIADWIDDLHDRGIINAEFESWDDGAVPPEPAVEEPKKLTEEHGWIDLGYTTDSIDLSWTDEYSDSMSSQIIKNKKGKK
jgi:hypothetical protein